MTVEEQKKMDALEAENAGLREENSGLNERLLHAQQTLAKYAQMLFGQKTERLRLPEKPDELTGNLFMQEMDPEEQARLDKEAAKSVAEQDKLIHVEAHDRKVRKPIDTSLLEVKEEHLYPELDNAAVKAVLRAPFTPARSEDGAVASTARLTVAFKIK